jgi:hypothetical protein
MRNLLRVFLLIKGKRLLVPHGLCPLGLERFCFQAPTLPFDPVEEPEHYLSIHFHLLQAQETSQSVTCLILP